jgi:acyl carrier protein
MLAKVELESRVNGIIASVMSDRGLTPPSQVGEDLFAAGLSSMGMVALMLAIESAFDIAIPNADLVPDNFRSVQAVEALLARLQSSATN